MTAVTIAAAAVPDPSESPAELPLTVPYADFDALLRGALATLAADAGGYPNPLGYLRDALGGITPRRGAHPREYVPLEPEDAVWGRY